MSALPQEIVRRKRDGKTLPGSEIQSFVRGLTDGSFSEGQIAAFAMAVYFQGLTRPELTTLTTAMRDSGKVLSWDLPGPVLDKHSTGGVGDNLSLMLAPMVAACGGYVPMISGRGLGHTGGTLDKLASIPGYQVAPSEALFRKTVAECGAAIIGQTGELAPADARLYSIRDITATVESLDLITASILSKKLAAGLDGLVMDVKTGNGAFMAARTDAEALAARISEVATAAGVPTRAQITPMDQPLAQSAGNALEVHDALRFFREPDTNPRQKQVLLDLCADLLILGKLAPDTQNALHQLQKALSSGLAAEIFFKMVSALGGPDDLEKKADALLPKAPVITPVYADRTGTIEKIDTRALGLAVVELGGGRRKPEHEIDPRVGLSALAELGQSVSPNTPLAYIHQSREDSLDPNVVRRAYEVQSNKKTDR